MKVLTGPIEALRVPLRLFGLSAGAKGAQPKHSLVFQRLFWGALAGCLMAVFFGDSPLLENLELSMLEWRYKTADQLALKASPRGVASKDIAIVAFDDSSQFDLGCPRFNDSNAQSILAEILETIESGDPSVVAVDLDLRGAANLDLVRVFRRYRNVVLAVFGSLEGSSDLPDAAFLKHAIGYGYDELARENNGQVLRLPINAPNQMGPETSGLAQVPSLTEATVSAYRQVKGWAPSDKLLRSMSPDQPIYINFQRVDYPVYSMTALREPGFNANVFRNRIVIIAPTLTSKRQDPSHVVTPLRGRTPEVYAHADAVNTILSNSMIFSYPRAIAHHILILLGATFGAVCSVLAAGRRTFFSVCGALALILVAQVSFQVWQVALPVVAPLAMLLSGYILGTVIYLDTDLRQRNRELAAAREHMQVRAEEERKRIAGDLHDETLPALSSVARMIDELYTVDDARKSSVPEKMRAKIDDTIAEMRRVINDLHPSVLETMGFVAALENLAVILSRDTGIEYNFIDRNGADELELTDFAKLQLYRIVQEALNNVGKHSHATHTEIKLQVHAGCLEISVADDGRGINPKLIRPNSHGLLNIRHRAQLIGATVEWRRPQAFHQGTEMRITVPLSAEKATSAAGDGKPVRDSKTGDSIDTSQRLEQA
jgi:signal transduction histidine kinase